VPGRGERPQTTAGSSRKPCVIAVLNSNQDVLRVIREALEDEGYLVATKHIVDFKEGLANLGQFLNEHQPSAMIYDLAPPYQENWNFLQLVQQIPDVAAIPTVLTTVNKAALDHTVGRTEAFEILGTRDNLAPMIERVNQVVRHTRLRRRRW
jgi:CheY-like chemotaxis protein